jgi:hypothetical protein
MTEHEPNFDVNVEERPGAAFDRLHLSLPIPRMFRLPEETRQHLLAARRERLLALRSLVDAAIDRMEKPETNPRRRVQKANTEKV